MPEISHTYNMADTEHNISEMRIVYDRDELLESQVASTPLEQFNRWLSDAVALGKDILIEPNAMVLSTATPNGNVSSRSVLLKGIDARGLVFFSNYQSHKAKEIENNPAVSVVFPWYPLHRQVIVIGKVEKISLEESEQYFETRPYKSQLGALVSNQSEEIESREILETRMRELELTYPEGQVPMPKDWGGYLIRVGSIEFWQGRRSRLHDRLRFDRIENVSDLTQSANWKLTRLSP